MTLYLNDGRPPTESSSHAYLLGLAEDLRIEATSLGVSLTPPTRGSDFRSVLEAYRADRRLVVGALDDLFEVARSYVSMEEFWEDAELQVRGESDHAFWDSYENGLRRRMEALVARTFGSQNAVLTTSGMAALDVALRSRLRPGDRLLVHNRSYFETSELIAALYGPWSVQVVGCDATDPDSLTAAIAGGIDVALVETVVNGPCVEVPRLDILLAAEVPVVLDNSAVGWALPASLLADQDLVVIESGTKYLCRQASIGVALGDAWVDAIRAVTRQTGVALQGRALHHIRPGEVSRIRERLALHADRLERFVAVVCDLASEELQAISARDGAEGRLDPLSRVLATKARGSMVYLRFRHSASNDEDAYRKAVAQWNEAVSGHRIRAGFGWTETSARAYGRDRLNTSEGDAFIRISVGIEPAADVETMAEVMVEALLSARTSK